MICFVSEMGRKQGESGGFAGVTFFWSGKIVKFRGDHRKFSRPYRSVQNETHHALLACCCLVLLCLWWGVSCVEFSGCLWCFLGREPCFCSGEKGGSDRASKFCPWGTPPFGAD